MTNFKVPAKLLGTKNAKTIKGEKKGYITYILYLAPFTQNSTGKNVCSHASKGCIEACLFGSGKGSVSNVMKGRINKTNYFLSNREMFLQQLFLEISMIELQHKNDGGKVAIRLNGTSDLAWEKFKIKDNKSIMELFPNVQFYDYTKNYLRFERELPKNYHLTFSKSETNGKKALEMLNKGFNVAIVFDELPNTFNGFEVVNGDENDLTFLQPKGVVLGLKYKKLTSKGADNNKAFESGFALRKSEIQVAAKAA